MHSYPLDRCAEPRAPFFRPIDEAVDCWTFLEPLSLIVEQDYFKGRGGGITSGGPRDFSKKL